MGIDRKLLQEVEKAGAELGRATIFFHESMARMFNLNSTDTRCLRFILTSKERLLAGDLAQFTGLTTGAVTGIIDRLEKAKMIRRIKDKNDRRKVWIEQSRQVSNLTRMNLSFSTSVSKVIRSFSDSELKIIIRYKKLITEVLDDETAKLKTS